MEGETKKSFFLIWRKVSGRNNSFFVKKFFSNEGASLQVSFLLLFFIFSFAAFGILGFLRHWRFLVCTQLRLNRCVAKSALDLKMTLNQIQVLNKRILMLRESLRHLQLSIELAIALRVALDGVVFAQEAQVFAWNAERWSRLRKNGCDNPYDKGMPAPFLALIRDPPDELGPQVLSWRQEVVEKFFILARHSPRAMAAEVSGGTIDGSDGLFKNSKKWRAFWISPKKVLEQKME